MPFFPESKLSDIDDRDIMAAVWYRRSFTLTKAQAVGRVVLHFGAVDYLATVAVNGTVCGSHKGGHVFFSFGGNVVLAVPLVETHLRELGKGGSAIWS